MYIFVLGRIEVLLIALAEEPRAAFLIDFLGEFIRGISHPFPFPKATYVSKNILFTE